MPKNILLVEPGYRNKYPPLGLMKLAAYHGPHGRGDRVRFVKGEDADVMDTAWDRVYVTTLFSFEWKRTAAAIDYAIRAAGGQQDRVFVGGIAATLMPERFTPEGKWAGVRFIRGLLDGPPATALQLSVEDMDFGADDLLGMPIEELVPDYSILDRVDYAYPVSDAYFGYASRGCVRKCSFCGVPQLEGAQRELPPLSRWVNGVRERFGEKKDLVLMDNNVAASARYREIIAEIADLGFERGATVVNERGGRVKRRVDFNQGVDARILAKSPMYLREMSKLCISPLRIAFDHIGVRKPYETAVRMAAENGIFSLSNYMLYNFMDTPEDLYQRLNVNIDLNEELEIRIWSFPMRYQPVNLADRSHVGRGWDRYRLRSFQMIQQATHGVVGGNPDFFRRAYGASEEEFLRLLSLPHAFIFRRDHYEFGEGRPVRAEYEACRRRLSPGQELELDALLSGEGRAIRPGEKRLRELSADRSIDPALRDVLRFHALGTGLDAADLLPPAGPERPADDEMVEDAGLFEPEAEAVPAARGMGLPVLAL